MTTWQKLPCGCRVRRNAFGEDVPKSRCPAHAVGKRIVIDYGAYMARKYRPVWGALVDMAADCRGGDVPRASLLDRP